MAKVSSRQRRFMRLSSYAGAVTVLVTFLIVNCHVSHVNGLRFAFLGDVCEEDADCIVIHSWCNATNRSCQCNEGYFPSLGSYLCEEGVKLGSLCVFHKQCRYLEPNSLCTRNRRGIIARCRCKNSYHEEIVNGKRICEPGGVGNGLENHINPYSRMGNPKGSGFDDHRLTNHVEEVGAVSLLPIILGIIGSVTVISTFFILAAYIFRRYRNRRQLSSWPLEHTTANISSAAAEVHPPPLPFSTLRNASHFPPVYSPCLSSSAYGKVTCPPYSSSSSVDPTQPYPVYQIPKNDPPPSYEEAIASASSSSSATASSSSHLKEVLPQQQSSP